MIDRNFLRIHLGTVAKVFLVEDRNYWPLCSANCNKLEDLVLCVDFALKQQLMEEGYRVEFIDHLANPLALEGLNVEMHNFMNTWFRDASGNDLLEYNGYNLGDALLLFLVNDISFFCHYFFNILALKAIDHKNIFVATDDATILSCLEKSGIIFTHLKGTVQASKPVYLFPIIKWVKQKTKATLRFKVKNLIANIFDLYFKFIDSFGTKRKAIYIQNYYPTEPIIQRLQSNKLLQLILPNYPGLAQVGKFRRVHYSDGLVSYGVAQKIIERYRKNRSADWYVFNYPMSTYLYELLDLVVEEHLADALNKAVSTEKSLKSVNLKLAIPVTNLWTPNRLIMQYCYKNKIPVFSIINGQLNTSYYHDAKDSDYVNSYSDSIKKNYFKNKSNALPLGDPRMDRYANLIPKSINRKSPTVIIGSAGYDSVDLNSYLAYEFDFLYDILFCIQKALKQGFDAKVILKVRGNGYLELYSDFIREYFGHLNISIVQNESFFDLIKKADLYISIFSQTIFEAACLGIPTIYYKKDSQFIHEPFDGNSELVTAFDVDSLYEKVYLYYNGSDIYDTFMKTEVLEKFIGPLDGMNTQKNIDLINKLVEDDFSIN